jgi:hypothetical protein
MRMRSLALGEAVHVEQPAVVRAAQAAVLHAAQRQVGAAVRAAAVDQADPVLVVSEQHQVLAEQAYGLRRGAGRQGIDQGNGLPVAAQQLTGRRAGAGLREVLVAVGSARLRAHGHGGGHVVHGQVWYKEN